MIDYLYNMLKKWPATAFPAPLPLIALLVALLVAPSAALRADPAFRAPDGRVIEARRLDQAETVESLAQGLAKGLEQWLESAP